jgi:hypothetical protein
VRKRKVSMLDSKACLVVVPMWFLPNSVSHSLSIVVRLTRGGVMLDTINERTVYIPIIGV